MSNNIIAEIQHSIIDAYQSEDFQDELKEWAKTKASDTLSTESRHKSNKWLYKSLNSCWQCNSPIPLFLKTSGAQPQFCIKCMCGVEVDDSE